MEVYDYIYLLLFVILIVVTSLYAWQTKNLVRANIEPLIFANDPDDYEWQVDINKKRASSSRY